MKWIVKGFAIAVLLLLLAVVAVLVLFDANAFKPKLEKIAQEHGVALDIKGDFGLTLWPKLGVEVNGIRVAPVDDPASPLAELEHASFLLALGPLFSGEIEVDHVLVDGVAISLSVDKNGKGNWESIAASNSAEEQSVSQTDTANEQQSGDGVKLAVEKVGLTNSRFSYVDQSTGQSVLLENLNLALEQFNLLGKPFLLSNEFSVRVESAEQGAKALDLRFAMQQDVTLAEDFDAVSAKGRVAIDVRDEQGASENITLNNEVFIKNLNSTMDIDARIDVPSFHAKKVLADVGVVLETKEAAALSDVSLKAEVKGTAQKMRVDPLHIHLDKTDIDGFVQVNDVAAMDVDVVLKGSAINVDNYLPPASEVEPTPTPVADSASGDEEIIPLAVVKSLKNSVKIGFDKITVADMPLHNVQLDLTAANGLVKLNTLKLKTYEGLLDVKGQLDGTGNTAKMKTQGKVEGFQLEPFIKDMELSEKMNFTGAVNADFNASLQGVTTNALMESLKAEMNVAGDTVRFYPLNLEQKFCQVVNLVNGKASTKKDWQEFSELEALSTKITVANNVVKIESLKAGIEELMLLSSGSLNLAKDQYRIQLPLKLIETQAANVAESAGNLGCVIGENYWLNRSMSLLECHGSLSGLSPLDDCGIDEKGLKSLVKDYAEYKIKKKHGDKIDAAEEKIDDKKQELKDKLEEKLGGDEKAKEAEDLLRGLLKKKK